MLVSIFSVTLSFLTCRHTYKYNSYLPVAGAVCLGQTCYGFFTPLKLFMTIIYIAHPISGDIQGNLQRIKEIARHITLKYPDVVAFAPYWFDCHFLDDDIPAERERGIKNDVEFFNRGIIDEVWLCGPRISKGMQSEKELAEILGIHVVNKIGFAIENL